MLPGGWGAIRGTARVASLALLAVALACAPGAAAQSPTTTSATMLTEGEYIGGSQHRFFYPGNGTISVSGSGGSIGVSVSGGTHGDSYGMSFASPNGQRFTPGLYTGAQRTPFREAGRPGINVSGDGRGCNEQAGRFDIKDIAYDSAGKVTKLWMLYEQHCEGGSKALFGEVKFNMPRPDPNLVVAQDEVWWPDSDPGRAAVPVPVFVANSGAEPRKMGASTITGADADDFMISDDACDRRVVIAGGLCKVWVRLRSTASGPRNATLQLRDESGIVDRVALSGAARTGKSTWSTSFGADGAEPVGFDMFGATFGGSGSHRSITISATRDAGGTYSAAFDAGLNDLLGSGRVYAGATVTGSSTTAGPKFKVTGTGINCTPAGGTFTVNWITYSVDDVLEDADISFEQTCSNRAQPLRGRVRLRSTGPEPEVPGAAEELAMTRTGTRAHLSWADPPDEDLEGVVVRYLEGTQEAPLDPQSGIRAYAGSGNRAVLTGLTPGRPLAVAIFTVDSDGLVSRATITSSGADIGVIPPPETTIERAPEPASNRTSETIDFSSDFEDSGFECSLDGASFAECEAPLEVTGLEDGHHRFEVRAVLDGQIDATPASAEWTVDTVAPDTTIADGPATPTASRSAHFELSSPDPDADFECSLDSTAWSPCAASVDLANLADGSHVLRVRATDRSGNTDVTPAEHRWVVDGTGPSVSIGAKPALRTIEKHAEFGFTSPDASASFECRLDDGDWLACSAPTSYQGLTAGVHVFSVRAVDPLGNVSPVAASYTWEVEAAQTGPGPEPDPDPVLPSDPDPVSPGGAGVQDRVPPELALVSKPRRKTSSRIARFAFSSNEPSVFACRLDDGPTVDCSSGIRFRRLSQGRHVFSVVAIDRAGLATSQEWRWRVVRRR